MNNISLFIDNAGKGAVPPEWRLKDPIRMQRLYYIKGGVGYMINADGSRQRFEIGKIYLTPYNMYQHFESDPTDPIDHIYIDFISTPPLIGDAPTVYTPENGTPLYIMIELLEAVLPRRGEPLEGEALTGLKRLLAALLEATLELLSKVSGLPFSNDGMIVSTLEYIRENYADRLSVSKLAAMNGFEVNYFIRRFRRAMGQTPYAYLRSYRLLCAKKLIAEGSSVSAAAEAVGFENASSLSRALRGQRGEGR